jgi:hypothetical protein
LGVPSASILKLAMTLLVLASITSGGYTADKNNTLSGGYAYVNFTNPYSFSFTFTGWVNVFYNC